MSTHDMSDADYLLARLENEIQSLRANPRTPESLRRALSQPADLKATESTSGVVIVPQENGGTHD